MKKLIYCLIILFTINSFANARAKLSGIAGKGGKDVKTSTTTIYQLLETYPLCTVTVYLAGTTTIASIYSDNIGSVKANPFSSNINDASYSFYANNGKYDIKFSGLGIASPYTLADISLFDYLENNFNVADYGILGVKHDGSEGSPTDESTNYLALLTIVKNSGGGVIIFNNKKYRIDSKWLIPNDGLSLPSQPSMRIIGQGPSHNGQGGAPNGGTIIDLRYNSSGAKIDTRGLGYLEIDHISFIDGNGSSSTDFFHSTNTTVNIHENEFYGTTANSPTQDGIVLGGVNTGASDGNFESPFQGYYSRVWGNWFNRIRRGLYAKSYANSISFQWNSMWTQCGGNAAVEFLPAGNSDSGNFIDYNLFEMGHYVNGVLGNNQFTNNTLGPNGFYDADLAVTNAYYRLESGAVYNNIISGFHEDTVPYFVRDLNPSPANDIDNHHQAQYSVKTQPIKFTNSQTKIVGDNIGLITEDATGNQWLQIISPAAGHPFIWYFNPIGGPIETGFYLYRDSSTAKSIIGGGSSVNKFTSVSDSKFLAGAGATVWFGNESRTDQILGNNTNLTFNYGISQNGTGLKHIRQSTGSIALSSSSDITVNLNGSAFANTNFTVTATVSESTGSLQVVAIKSQTASTVVVTVKNNDGAGAHTGTLNVICIHD